MFLLLQGIDVQDDGTFVPIIVLFAILNKRSQIIVNSEYVEFAESVSLL